MYPRFNFSYINLHSISPLKNENWNGVRRFYPPHTTFSLSLFVDKHNTVDRRSALLICLRHLELSLNFLKH